VAQDKRGLVEFGVDQGELQRTIPPIPDVARPRSIAQGHVPPIGEHEGGQKIATDLVRCALFGDEAKIERPVVFDPPENGGPAAVNVELGSFLLGLKDGLEALLPEVHALGEFGLDGILLCPLGKFHSVGAAQVLEEARVVVVLEGVVEGWGNRRIPSFHPCILD